MTAWVPGVVIDVSKYQPSLPSLTGVIGVIARAGIGTKPDPMFVSHITDGRAAGKWVGSYWYNWGALTPSEQVNAYIAREQEVGGVDLHTIDWEGSEGFTAAQTAEFIRIYQQRTGDPILLYASEGRFRDLGQDGNWIANYSSEPNKAYDMWQYGPFRGVDGNHAKQKIIDLVRGTTMAGPEVRNLTSLLGTATVVGTGHSAILANDGSLIGLAPGTVKDVVATGTVAPWAGHSGVLYLVGSEPAYLAKEDVTFVAAPVADCSALQDTIDQQADIIAALKTEVAVAETYKATTKAFLG